LYTLGLLSGVLSREKVRLHHEPQVSYNVEKPQLTQKLMAIHGVDIHPYQAIVLLLDWVESHG
jgi:hypothetical protein